MINLINKYWSKKFTFEAKILIIEILWLSAGKKNHKEWNGVSYEFISLNGV